MHTPHTFQLDPSTLAAFTATLGAVPAEEVRKAKLLFLKNAIADYQMSVKTFRGFVIVFGVMSIIPVFLVVFIPAFLSYRALRDNGKRKIMNALEVWRPDLGPHYEELVAELG